MSWPWGLARRAREMSSDNYYVQAEAALEKSFQIAPDNLEGRRAQVCVLLGKHEFAQALKGAKALNQRMPDDVLVYGLLADRLPAQRSTAPGPSKGPSRTLRTPFSPACA